MGWVDGLGLEGIPLCTVREDGVVTRSRSGAVMLTEGSGEGGNLQVSGVCRGASCAVGGI